MQRLLAFARRQPLKPEPVDVSALILGMSELIGTTTGPQVALRLDLAADLPMAVADPHQVEMALLNLAVNARDAMPNGGALTIAAVARDAAQAAAAGAEPGDYVMVRVADTGIGMDAETRHRAIEPFFTTKGIGQGTGLGLSMAHGLARQLGGTLTIDSEPGVGTAISLWFPATSAPFAAVGPVAVPPAPAMGVALLVDDEDLVRESTADMLADLGFTVIEASSGAEALAILGADERVAVLVSDHLMPAMTGAELARAALALRPGLPVLITSGYSDAVGLASGLPRLEKPFRQAELSAALTRIMPARVLATAEEPAVFVLTDAP